MNGLLVFIEMMQFFFFFFLNSKLLPKKKDHFPAQPILNIFSPKFHGLVLMLVHTTYSRNNMHQKCEGDCGLWVLNEIDEKKYPENMKKIVGAIWELPAK